MIHTQLGWQTITDVQSDNGKTHVAKMGISASKCVELSFHGVKLCQKLGNSHQ